MASIIYQLKNDTKYKWRTVSAIKRLTGLTEEEINEYARKYPNIINRTQNINNDPLFSLKLKR
jgi:hypothetical protein